MQTLVQVFQILGATAAIVSASVAVHLLISRKRTKGNRKVDPDA